jgi:hypothetical protein
MKVIRYVNGKKVQDLPETESPVSNPVVIPAPKRVVQKVTPLPPPSQSITPTKGCGCGR